jgi:hypothetical protein
VNRRAPVTLAALFLALLLPACACTTTGARSSASSSDPAAACENLARLGCAIGQNPRCDSALALAVVENHTTASAIACVQTASSASAIASCNGDAATPYFVCR